MPRAVYISFIFYNLHFLECRESVILSMFWHEGVKLSFIHFDKVFRIPTMSSDSLLTDMDVIVFHPREISVISNKPLC